MTDTITYSVKTGMDKPFIIENTTDNELRISITFKLISDQVVELWQGIDSFDNVTVTQNFPANQTTTINMTILSNKRFYYLLKSTGEFAAEITVTYDNRGDINLIRVSPVVDVLDEVDLDDYYFLVNPIYPLASDSFYKDKYLFYDNENIYVFSPDETSGYGLKFERLLDYDNDFVNHYKVQQTQSGDFLDFKDGKLTQKQPDETVILEKEVGFFFGESPDLTESFDSFGNLVNITKNPFEDYVFMLTDAGLLCNPWCENGENSVLSLDLLDWMDDSIRILPYAKQQALIYKLDGNNTLFKDVRALKTFTTNQFDDFHLRKAKIVSHGFYVVGYKPSTDRFEIRQLDNTFTVVAQKEVDLNDFIVTPNYIGTVIENKFVYLNPGSLSLQNAILLENQFDDYSKTLQIESDGDFVVQSSNGDVYVTPDNKNIYMIHPTRSICLFASDAFETIEENMKGFSGVFDLKVNGEEIYFETFDKTEGAFVLNIIIRQTRLSSSLLIKNVGYRRQVNAAEKIVENACQKRYRFFKAPFLYNVSKDLNGIYTLTIINSVKKEMAFFGEFDVPIYPFKLFNQTIHCWKTDTDIIPGTITNQLIHNTDTTLERVSFSQPWFYRSAVEVSGTHIALIDQGYLVVYQDNEEKKFFVGKLFEPEMKSDHLGNIYIIDVDKIKIYKNTGQLSEDLKFNIENIREIYLELFKQEVFFLSKNILLKKTWNGK